jgi:hypothetical protein
LKTVSNSEPLALLNTSTSSSSEDLLELTRVVQAAAQHREGDCIALLALLRLLNELHSEIRDTLFREALPDNRQRLYRLLRDIEQEGGWPYIQRTKLVALLEQMDEAAEHLPDATNDSSDTSHPKS